MSDKQVSKTNGTPPALPEDRKAAVAYGLEQFQVMAHDRDNAISENHQLRADIAGYKIALEAMQTQLANADSRVAEMTLIRDQATARAIKWEVLWRSVKAQLNAFQIPSEPHIAEPDDDA